MLKKGQIEDKEAGKLKNEIDKMIVNLEMHDPEIQLLDQYQKILHHSRLFDIFDQEDLKKAFGDHKSSDSHVKMKEQIHQSKERIVKHGQKYDKILYVARGKCVEKIGDLQRFQDR